MSSSKGDIAFWSAYATLTEDTVTVIGYEYLPIPRQDWGLWHEEFENSLEESDVVSSHYDELCEFMIRKFLVGDVVKDPFTELLEEI